MLLKRKTEKTAINTSSRGNGYILTIATGASPSDVHIPTSAPAKHFDVILNQIANLVTVYQNEIMGAVAFSSFDTLLAPFVKNDKLKYNEVKQAMQNFVLVFIQIAAVVQNQLFLTLLLI